MEFLNELVETLTTFPSQSPWITGFLSAALAALGGTGVFAFKRRIRPADDQAADVYFRDEKLLAPPLRRPAYSDRMAYVLAEMSDLAYFQFEDGGGIRKDAVQELRDLDLSRDEAIEEFLASYTRKQLTARVITCDIFRDVLEAAGFELLATIDVDGTQGFACKRTRAGEPPYIVIAFRGTEKKLSDWLTDARVVPTEIDQARVHSGFLEAFSERRGSDGRTVEDHVRAVLASKEARDDRGEPLPVFITGHSLGGALALIATRIVAPNIEGACYTFGAPRVADYEYVRYMKTPVFRIVNSSDIVPRVPLGAGNTVVLGAVRLLGWLTKPFPAVSSLFGRVESLIDKLNGYRHFGDLRYLTDVASGHFDTVRLLSNPPATDQLIWMWKHVAASFRVPLTAHGMAIYRKKLHVVANDRARKVE